ncbi:MAG: molybdopterin-synthase adenylyltransferase MoeB [Pseudomonadota bacterium]|jgi:adenylyltransferase/sulfurtransferase|nr:molybdopterin-synthase adenylyltransferase MoeB [Pseudomonadota bacterium]|tara:strand:- start:2539 stop:3279 length:741 start_codon:yes stop_codon:yes gene_type:complete
MDDKQLLRYSRQIMLPEIDVDGQERIKNSKVLLIGLGGLGSPISIYLTAAGVGELIIADFDKVNLSNLQRQILHKTRDINRSKIDSAKEHLHELNPDINIRSIGKKLSENDLMNEAKKSNIIIDASDNFNTRFSLNKISVKSKTPLVSGAAIRFEGQVTVFNPAQKSSPCYRCLYNEDVSTEESCTANGVFAPLLGIVGSIQANEALKLILNLGESIQGKLLLIDALNMEFNEVFLNKDPSCPVCN